MTNLYREVSSVEGSCRTKTQQTTLGIIWQLHGLIWCCFHGTSMLWKIYIILFLKFKKKHKKLVKILFYVNPLKTRRKKYPSPKWTFETLLELKIYTCTTIPSTIHEHAHTEVLHYSPFSSWPDMQVVEGHRGSILWFPDLSFFMQFSYSTTTFLGICSA